MAKKRIPLLFLTGLLGAGKTSFLNRILKENTQKTAVLINEYASVGIDADWIQAELMSQSAAEVIELTNGCICCLVSNEFKKVLLEKSKTFSKVDLVLVELSGQADPLMLYKECFSDPGFSELYEWRGSICLVDSTHFEMSVSESELFKNQLIASDTVLVTKMDLQNELEKAKCYEQIRKTVRSLNPIVESYLVQDFELSNYRASSKRFITTYSEKVELIENHVKNNPLALEWVGELEFKQVQSFFQALVLTYSKEVVRTKAVFWIKGKDRPYLVHFVRGLVDKREIAIREKVNKLVLFTAVEITDSSRLRTEILSLILKHLQTNKENIFTSLS